MRQVGASVPPTQAQINASAANYAEQMRQRQLRQNRAIIDEAECTALKPVIRYDFPSHQHQAEADRYNEAYTEIATMLDHGKPDLLRANYLTENAYHSEFSYSDYQQAIGDIGQFLNEQLANQDVENTSNHAKNRMLFRFFSDTLQSADGQQTHYPITYDFEDYMGREDWSNMFVSKVLKTNSGQCHSLPLLYLILAEELGADASLSFSPAHSYIQFQDKNGVWVNVELTNNMMTSDAFILESGFVKAEAVANGLYMDRMQKSDVIAYQLYDLAKGYMIKYGMDKFVLQCLDKALEHDPNNVNALALKSDYCTLLLNYQLQQIGTPPLEVLKQQYPRAYATLRQRDQMYDMMDQLGYEYMPPEAYEKWLSSLNEKQKQEESKWRVIQLNKQLD